MFRPLYRPSSGCTFSYFKAKYTIYTFLFFVNEISCTAIKSAFKVTTVAVKLKSYSEIKYINSIKSWVCDLGGGGWLNNKKLEMFIQAYSTYMPQSNLHEKLQPCLYANTSSERNPGTNATTITTAAL
jgi:hypothetical protein